ncbi:hypothetical protein FB466_1399 [Klugiella xanthotipulae]|uniref:Uncharacterized protein n=1 Tax=Klugiella xanthotipulae TaxID=244735 RepID=A0A543HY22_9MICO|nr:hypothetical protein FB466_1399 [Klugiella xanthotipulae]
MMCGMPYAAKWMFPLIVGTVAVALSGSGND